MSLPSPIIRQSAILMSSVGLATAAGHAVMWPQTPQVAIVSATIITAADRLPIHEGTLVIADRHVACVGSRTECPVPRGAKIINGAAHWVIPGLFDAHVHITEEHGPFAPLYLAFGITSVRDVGGYTDSLIALRQRLSSGQADGARVYLAGRPLDGDPPQWPPLYPLVPLIIRTPEDARQAVREAQGAGVDFIKLYGGLDIPELRAATEEAHGRHLKVTADLMRWPYPPDSAIAARLDGFEHTLPPPGGDVLAWSHDSSGMMARLERMKAAGIALTSTLVQLERVLPAVPDTLATYKALPRPLQQRSREMLPESRGGQLFRYACQTVRAYAHMGGLVLAGTDSYYLVLYPGDLHRELELLVQCGLSSAQALAAATRNPAAWLRADSVGILAPGKLADIVLIRGDPLKRISATQEIDLVVQAGQIYHPADLILEARNRAHRKDR